FGPQTDSIFSSSVTELSQLIQQAWRGRVYTACLWRTQTNLSGPRSLTNFFNHHRIYQKTIVRIEKERKRPSWCRLIARDFLIGSNGSDRVLVPNIILKSLPKGISSICFSNPTMRENLEYIESIMSRFLIRKLQS